VSVALATRVGSVALANPVMTASGTAGTQSVSSSLAGARAQAPAAAATKPAAKPSASSSSAIGNDSAVPAGARFGIPCVY